MSALNPSLKRSLNFYESLIQLAEMESVHAKSPAEKKIATQEIARLKKRKSLLYGTHKKDLTPESAASKN